MQVKIDEARPAHVTESEQLLTEVAAAGRGARPAASPEFLRQIEKEIPFLERTVRRWHRNKADADDLVQDTLVQALANAHLWQPGSDLRAWLFTIMRNRFLAGAIRSTRSAAAMERIGAARSAPLAEEGELRLICATFPPRCAACPATSARRSC